jgi:D-lactate dehydrogenase
MTEIYWVESFSEERETVKEMADSPSRFHFQEEPIQSLDPDTMKEDSIITIRTHSRFRSEHVEKADCIISRSTGYDHLIEQRDRLANVPVGYLSEYATNAVAEHNLAAALSLLKRFPESTRAAKQFHRNNLTGFELLHRNPGIVGVGNIGGRTAELLLDLGLTVRGHDPDPRPRYRASNRFSYCSLEELFEQCDLIFLCLPLTETTNQLIDRSLLEQLSEQSFLINSGRGEVVQNQDLLNELDDGPLAGVALDVYNEENKVSNDLQSGERTERNNPEVQAAKELIEHNRVLATPHNAFNTQQSLEAKVRTTLDNIESFRNDGTLLTPLKI